MNKSDSLLQRVGTGLAESIGIRPGQSTKPQYHHSVETPKADFVRNRSAGDISPHEVMPDPDQPRKHFDDQELEHLAQDIAARGQLAPIRVRWSATHGKWLIIAGERRWRAVQKAGLDKISCLFIDRDMSENEIRSEQLVENLLREDLTGMEEAKAFQSLMQLNSWSAAELAENLHVSRGKVSKSLALLKLPEHLQAKVAVGEITPSTAYELVKVKDQSQLNALAEQASAGSMTQAEAAKATKRDAKAKRSTNEKFQTADKVTVHITSRRDLGEQGMIQALVEVAERIRQRSRSTKAA